MYSELCLVMGHEILDHSPTRHLYEVYVSCPCAESRNAAHMRHQPKLLTTQHAHTSCEHSVHLHHVSVVSFSGPLQLEQP
jgi:hypothetical protein